MASAQAMEEELQQSVLLSQEPDDNYDASNATPGRGNTKVVSFSKTPGGADGTNNSNTDNTTLNDGMASDRDASGEDEDASGEDDIDMVPGQGAYTKPLANGHSEVAQEDEELDEDAEGEDDDEIVGAVKIKPAELDEDDEEAEEEAEVDDNDDSDASVAQEEDSDEEEEAPWEDARDEVEGDDESEVTPLNVCVFCKQDEEHDPSEDFEAFLACRSCGENAHQQCARDEDAMNEHNDASQWRCPECYADVVSDEAAVEEEESAATDARPVSQDSEVPLLVKAGEEDITMADDTSGSRSLRKRKTSSTTPEESILALRKRRRNASADLRNDEDADESESRSVRSSRLKSTRQSSATIEKHTRTSLVVKLQVRSGNLKDVMARSRQKRATRAAAGPASGPTRPSRGAGRTPARPSRNGSDLAAVADNAAPLIETPFTADLYSQPFYSFFDRDTDDKGKPYGDILTEAEADTTKTLPATEDRKRFDDAKREADAEWRARVMAMQAEADVPVRKHKKNGDHASHIECIEFGGWEIDTWYAAPYPAEYSRNRVLYICEFCLKYMNSDYVAWRHKLKCSAKHPPGDEIYRHGSISFFEVDGRKNPVYCQNLCLLAKLFLGSKTLYYDVEPFLFYVLCEYDECGYHFVGYFSKEKRPSSLNNVSCILTLPIHQRKGYGNLLIDFSYLLTKVEEKTGSPEKPLSDLGLVSYRSYWRLVLCRYLVETLDKGSCKASGLSIKQISDETAMTPDDVVAALEGLRAIVRDPQTKLYAFRVDVDFCRQYVANWESKGHVKLKPEALAWTPYVMGRGVAANLEMAPISTVAPREEDEARLDEGSSVARAAETKAMVNGIKKAAAAAAAAEKEAGAKAAEDGGPDGQLQEEATSQGNGVGASRENGDDNKENATVNGDKMDVDEVPWDAAYKDIPATRFEIFPPMTSGRRGADRRPAGNRPAASSARRVSSTSTPRPRPRRPSGTSSARRTSSAARPKSASSSRRKTGGTGRGPGRWPKGTKKADYGNATSGPGFPPGWREKQQQTPQTGEAAAAIAVADTGTQQEVRVLFANGNGGATTNGDGKAGEGDVDAEGEDDV